MSTIRKSDEEYDCEILAESFQVKGRGKRVLWAEDESCESKIPADDGESKYLQNEVGTGTVGSDHN